MANDTPRAAEDAQVRAIRLTMLGVVDQCLSFAEGVEAGDIDHAATPIVVDQIQFLHERRKELAMYHEHLKCRSKLRSR